MTFRAITAANDWTFGQGRGSYFAQNNAIVADIKTALLFFLNDCFFAMTTGIDWWNLLGAKNPQATQDILLQVRATIITREGVTRIVSVSPQVDPVRRRIRIVYVVDTIFSRNVVGSVQTP